MFGEGLRHVPVLGQLRELELKGTEVDAAGHVHLCALNRMGCRVNGVQV